MRWVLSCRSLNSEARCRRAGPLCLLLLTAVLTGCGGTGPQDSSTERDQLEKGIASIPVASRVERRLLAEFSILKNPPEEVPASIRQAFRHPVFGANVKLARRIPIDAGGSTYWLLPGNKHLCIVSRGNLNRVVSTVCESTSNAITHGIAIVSISLPSSPHRTRTIVGVAPHSARQALVSTNGGTLAVPVRNEIFVLEDSTLEPPEQIWLRKDQSDNSSN